MKDRKLATRYARALLGVLSDPRQAESADTFLASLGRAMEASPEFRGLMLDPAFPSAARKSALAALAKRAAQPPAMVNFLATLVANGRAPILASIAAAFHEERERALGVVPAELVSAAPLAPEVEQRAGATLERLTGRKVRLTCRVDPTLLGGAVTQIGSMVYDGSLRTQLARLHRKMAQE